MSFKSVDNSFIRTFENRKLNFSTSDLSLHKLYINKKKSRITYSCNPDCLMNRILDKTK